MRGPRRDAVVVMSYSPFPVTTGGRKRAVRLVEAIERVGLQPRLVVVGACSDEAADEADARGWKLDVVTPAGRTPADRVRVHTGQYLSAPSRGVQALLRDAASTAAFLQFEEIRSVQYLPRAPASVPRFASLHNVDSQLYDEVAGTRRGLAAARGRYVARRMRAVERRAARAADAVIVVSEHDRDGFSSLGARRTVLVPNGVDPDLLAVPVVPPRTGHVLFFGGFDWEPNVHGLLRFVDEAWPLVRRRRPDAELRVAGAGIERVRDRLDGVDGVRVLGFVPDLLGELAGARVVVAPLWLGGGTRMKVLEALTAGRPVVGTAVGVERIGFESGTHGLIADDPRGLADATVRVLDDDDAFTTFSHHGRELGSGFLWTSVTRAAEELYRHWAEHPAAVAG